MGNAEKIATFLAIALTGSLDIPCANANVNPKENSYRSGDGRWLLGANGNDSVQHFLIAQTTGSASPGTSSSPIDPGTASAPDTSTQTSDASQSLPGLGQKPDKSGVVLSPGTAGSSESVRTVRPTLIFVPKFRERLINLGDQIRMVQAKGFISAEESSAFLSRQAVLLEQETTAAKNGFQRAEVDSLEKAITLLNSDLFKASKKSDPVKPGPAETEVNDPNLIPAYPDAELQPGSGKK